MDYPLIRAVVFALGLCAAILIGLGFWKVAEYLHWRGNRGHWRKLVEDREKYVEMGCPKWEYNKYGQLTFTYDPFRGTIGGWLTDVGRMEDYPDLNERDTNLGWAVGFGGLILGLVALRVRSNLLDKYGE